jgi:hypothetical protein
MAKVLFLFTILMSLTLASCGKSGSSSSPAANTEESLSADTTTANGTTETDDAVTGVEGTEDTKEVATTITPTSTLPAQALSFKANISYMNLTAAQTTKYNKAVAIVKSVVATEAFRTKVLNYTYAGQKQFADNKGRTNAQIYQTILDAAESLKPIKNNTMDLGVKMYTQASSVVGFTNASITYINVNTKFFNTYAANQVAGNLFHEWLHKLGYTHDASATAKRPYTVPYAVGYIVRDLGKNFL